MKADFLFAGVNLNRTIQKKKYQKEIFFGWCFKNKCYYIFQCWDLVVVCPPPIKISGYAPGSKYLGVLNISWKIRLLFGQHTVGFI